MSGNNKQDRKSQKQVKSPSRLGVYLMTGNSKSQTPALVPPVLREVGKLAAGVASVSTLNTQQPVSGSATGNPRNKVALQPGHSLMDWIRLGTSGKDLTGLGPRAGSLGVTRQELAKHNSRFDAWTAIRGRVYNLTEYFPFHPGGEEELIKGAGIDATDLFDQVHPWVNYEQILQKCLVGKLIAVDPSVDTEALFFGDKTLPSAKPSVDANRLEVSSAKSPAAPIQNDNPPPKSTEEPPPLPRFDWIQKLEYITLIFYTKAFSNPFVEVQPPVDEQTVIITLSYQDRVFTNELIFYEKVRWPCDVSVAIETGKVEFVFRKLEGGVWDNYGVLRQQSYAANDIIADQVKSDFILKKKVPVNHNTWLLKFERHDGRKVIVPVGKHVRVFGNIDGTECSRSFTPVPESLFHNFIPHSTIKNNVCLMIKQYPDGNMSRFVPERNIEECLQFSKPLGTFDVKVVEKRETFLMLAAGSGITPMLGLIMFLLERRIKKCQFLRLLFFNKTEDDILFGNQLDNLAELDNRFKVVNVLSQASDSWTGHRGHVNASLIESSLQEHLKDTGYTIKDAFCFICGPSKFNNAACQELDKVKVTADQVFVFEG